MVIYPQKPLPSIKQTFLHNQICLEQDCYCQKTVWCHFCSEIIFSISYGRCLFIHNYGVNYRPILITLANIIYRRDYILQNLVNVVLFLRNGLLYQGLIKIIEIFSCTKLFLIYPTLPPTENSFWFTTTSYFSSFQRLTSKYITTGQ